NVVHHSGSQATTNRVCTELLMHYSVTLRNMINAASNGQAGEALQTTLDLARQYKSKWYKGWPTFLTWLYSWRVKNGEQMSTIITQKADFWNLVELADFLNVPDLETDLLSH